MNMGTPMHPEGTPHWSTKAVLWHRLKNALYSEGPASYYGRAAPHELRSITADHLRKQPGYELLESALEAQRSRPYPRRSCFHIAYREPSDCKCGGGFPVVHNLLKGLKGGRAELEEPFDRFTPDISLYARDAWEPTAVIEVVDTSSPSWKKIDAMRLRGVEVYVVRVRDDAKGGDDTDPGYLQEPFVVEPVAVPCRRPNMVKLFDLDDAVWGAHKSEMEAFSSELERLKGKYEADGNADLYADCLGQLRIPDEAYIGIKEFPSNHQHQHREDGTCPLDEVDRTSLCYTNDDGQTWVQSKGSGTQQFIYGRASHAASFKMGDAQVRAFTMSQTPMFGPELVEPITEKGISRDLFMEYLVLLKLWAFTGTIEWNEAGRPRNWRPRINPTRHVDQIDDLLCMVGWPNGGRGR